MAAACIFFPFFERMFLWEKIDSLESNLYYKFHHKNSVGGYNSLEIKLEICIINDRFDLM